MKKSNKQHVDLPDVINTDDLAIMTDEQLFATFRALDAARTEAFNAIQNTQSWEIELSYVKREIYNRRYRRQLHEEFLVRQDADAVLQAAQEHLYPVADLDNSEFIFV